MGLAAALVPDQEEQGLDRSARPSLDEVLGVRDSQAAGSRRGWLAEVTPEQLARTAPVPDGDGWPLYARGRRVRQCLGTVLDEEWAWATGRTSQASGLVSYTAQRRRIRPLSGKCCNWTESP